jgi:RimJ/RimL family protein N-acetyltransferase
VDRRSLAAVGRRFELRPAAESDAPFMVGLRVDPELSRFLNPTSPVLEDQEAWIEAKSASDDDYPFILEDRCTGAPEGTISLYHVDWTAKQAELGRFLMRRGSLAAAEGVLLVYRVAFDKLGLDRVYCRTIADNQHVISFHRSCGLVLSTQDLSVELKGTRRGVVEQHVLRASWPEVEMTIDRAARNVARLLERSVKAAR